MNKVYLSVKNGLESFVDCSPSLVSDKWLPVLVRQKALLANVCDNKTPHALIKIFLSLLSPFSLSLSLSPMYS